MKKFFFFFALFTILISHKAKGDQIVIKGDTLSMVFFSPFDNYTGITKLRNQLKDYVTNCTEDNCSFLSTWKIINDRLALIKIENCKCNDHKQSANLKMLFGKQLDKGLLYADWYTGEIWVTKERPNSWRGIFAASWPGETRLIVKKGRVISVKNFVYPKPIETIYYRYSDSLENFIYTHLNWDKFQDLTSKKFGFYFTFDQDAGGYMINLKQDEFLRPDQKIDKDEMQEISRVAGLIQWPLYYYHGEPVKHNTGFNIVLSKEIQKKFTKPD